MGFRAYWRWKSRKRAGRPKLDRGLRELIQQMSQENPLWGASRIHGELLRPHRSLQKDAPMRRTVQRIGDIVAIRSSADYITNTSGYEFRKEHDPVIIAIKRYRAASAELAKVSVREPTLPNGNQADGKSI